jgi:phosphodiesterase/alkaline phosphatase D-like protein
MHATTFPPCALLSLAASLLAAASLPAQFQFTGIASGDASASDAIVWTRAVDAGAPAAVTLALDIAPNDLTLTVGVATFSTATDASRDYTARLLVTGLQPGTRYYYRFANGVIRSDTGTFVTAPAPTAAAPVRFAFSGDCDGLMRPYPLASVFPAQALDFFVFLGDTIYETASSGSAAAASTGTQPAPSATGALQAQLFADYSRKYREQFAPVNAGGQSCLKPLFAAQGNYTLLDNHELGNRQYINGGAPPGGPVGDMATGAGVDARQAQNDVNTTGTFMNRAAGFQTLQNVFVNYQPVRDRGVVSAPADPRSDGTPVMYFGQQWGRNVAFFSVDDRSYRDIRMKTAANADETTAPRASNPGRTMLGATQLAWLEQSLLAAQTAGVLWKIVAISSPIDQLGPIGGALPGIAVGSDGGKSWMGGYRAERNALLQFIADHGIYNVVFLSTDDHQNRINEVLYSPTGQTEVQSSYVPVPHCFIIVDGPLGATGPETITDHSLANIQSLANAVSSAQVSMGLDPIGLSPGYPGLHNVVREGDPGADAARSTFDFYSPDTFNFAALEVSADGGTLTVRVTGIDSRPTNSFGEYDPVGNPARQILSFEVDAFASASVSAFGTGCGLPAPILSPVGSQRPLLGTTQQTDVVYVPAGSSAFMAVGGSSTSLGALPLPLALDAFGLPGCLLYHDLLYGFANPCAATGPGSARHSLAIPNSLVLLDLPVYLQAWAPDATANPGGLVVSNALELVLGNF